MTDYYSILGVEKNASGDDIKNAYRKLAREHHPDKGGDKERFQEIQKAYETLSDPQRRQEYDSPSPFGRSGSGGGDPFGFNFESFFEMNGFGRGGSGSRMSKCNNHFYHCKVTLRDIYFGITKTIKITRRRHCEKCRRDCNDCGGSGMLQRVVQLGPIRQIIQQQCNSCGGTGRKEMSNKDCGQCKGENTISEERLVEIKIPRGSNSEQQIVIEGWGEQPTKGNSVAGDLVVLVSAQPDQHFTREGMDLVYTEGLSLAESIVGKEMTIPHYTGEIRINTNTLGIINPNKRYRISGKGMVKEFNASGDLFMRFDIKYPERTFTREELDMLTNVFGKLKLV
jgi:DnaJ homolog subfamily A member 2